MNEKIARRPDGKPRLPGFVPIILPKACVMKIAFVAPLVFTVLLSTLSPAEEQAQIPSANAATEQSYGSVEERRLKESLQEGGIPFAREREELDNKKKELKRLESEVDKKIEQLNQLRVRIEKLLEQKDAEEQKRIAELAKVYEKMTAEKAATVMGTIEQQLAIAILAKMKTKSAAKILNNMERDKAAKLTTAFSTLESH